MRKFLQTLIFLLSIASYSFAMETPKENLEIPGFFNTLHISPQESIQTFKSEIQQIVLRKRNNGFLSLNKICLIINSILDFYLLQENGILSVETIIDATKKTLASMQASSDSIKEVLQQLTRELDETCPLIFTREQVLQELLNKYLSEQFSFLHATKIRTFLIVLAQKNLLTKNIISTLEKTLKNRPELSCFILVLKEQIRQNLENLAQNQIDILRKFTENLTNN